MTRYWTSWYEPVASWDPRDGLHNDPVYSGPAWPETVTVIGTWITGFRMSDDAQTVCALVESTSRLAIEQALEGRTLRFFEERDADWMPGERFPLEDPSQQAVATPPIV